MPCILLTISPAPTSPTYPTLRLSINRTFVFFVQATSSHTTATTTTLATPWSFSHPHPRLVEGIIHPSVHPSINPSHPILKSPNFSMPNNTTHAQQETETKTRTESTKQQIGIFVLRPRGIIQQKAKQATTTPEDNNRNKKKQRTDKTSKT